MSTDSWHAGISGNWSAAADWSAGIPSAGVTASISGQGGYVVTLFGAGTAAALILNAPGAEFYDAGALTLGGTLALQSGTLALAYGAINGGVLAMEGGTLSATGGMLNGVTVQGMLALSAPDATLFLQDGLILQGAGGTGAGSVSLTGAGSSLTFFGTQTVNDAVIGIGASGNGAGPSGPATLAVSNAQGAMSGGTLTLGTAVWLRDSGGQAALVAGSTSPIQGAGLSDMLDNLGTITAASAGATLALSGSGSFVNQGSIGISNGATLILSVGSFDNTGAIGINDATLALGGTFSSARLSGLGVVAVTHGVVEISGLMENGGSTLSLGGGSAITGSLGALTLAGTVQGGTVLDSGGGLNFGAGTGTLSGVLYQGTLNLSASGAGVTLAGNAEIDSSGGGAGILTVTGQGASLLLQGTETLNNAAIALGASGEAACIGTDDAWLASNATTATLGAGVTVTQQGEDAVLKANGWSPVAGLGPADVLINQGSIVGSLAGGQFGISGYGSFINEGSITISGGDTLSVTVARFGNAGTVTVGAGGMVTLGEPAGFFGAAPSWSNAGEINVSGGTLVLGGAVTTAQLGRVSETQGLVVLDGTLSNAGATLALGAGASLAGLSLDGTIVGGTILDTSSALSVGDGGTALLDGATYDGTLALTQAGAALQLRDGLALTGALDVLGAGSEVLFLGVQTINDTSILLGAMSAAATIATGHWQGQSGASILSLGSSLTVTQAGLLADIGGAASTAGDEVVNEGTITAGFAGGTLTLSGPGFTNQGQVDVSNGETLVIATADFSNTGIISVSNATLSLAGSLSLAGLGTLDLNNAVVAESGRLDLGGGTLSIGEGSSIGRVSLTGTLSGGVIADSGGGLACSGAADLSDITYWGVLDLSRPFTQLAFANGLTLTGQSGAGAGSILLTGAACRLLATGSETLDDCTITLGSVSQTYNGQYLAPPELAAGAGVQLTLGANAVIRSAGAGGMLGDAAYGAWTDSIVNAGQIITSLAGGTLTLGSSFFTNAGTISAVTGGILVIADTAFANTGTLDIGAGSVVQVSLYDFFAAPNAGVTVVSNDGVIAMGGGILHEMTANGLFPTIPFANGPDGEILGTGQVMAPVVNSGLIEAQGGTLSIQGSVLGAGTLLIEAGATLDLPRAVSAGQTVSFASNKGTLRLGQPSSFAGTIAQFVGGDVVDLPGRALTSIAISGGDLVMTTAAHVFRLAAATPLAGALEAGRDGHGGATVAIVPSAGGGVGGGPTVMSVYQPGMLFWTTPAGDILQGSAANMNGTTLCNWSDASSLDVTDLAPSVARMTVSAVAGGTRLALTGGTGPCTMKIDAVLSAGAFHLAPDGHGGTVISTHG
jgi:hypothetical protein